MRKRALTLALACVFLALIIAPTTAIAADPTEQFNQLAGTNYKYGDFMTRESYCVAISKLFAGDPDANTALPFEDIDEINAESIPYLASLYRQGILTGSKERDGLIYMLPNSNISRQEAITLLGKVLSASSDARLGFTDSDSVAPYARSFIAWFADYGIIRGYTDGSLRPAAHINAGELAFLTLRTLDHLQRSATNVTTFFGTGSQGHIDGNKDVARFFMPAGVIRDGSGNITVFDTFSNSIRVIKSNNAETLTGGSRGIVDESGFPKGYYLDAAVKDALFSRPAGGVVNMQGELFIADSANHVIRHIKNGVVYTFSGTTEGYSDGARDKAQFNTPMAIAIDRSNNLYVADTLNNCIRKIDPRGGVTTIAGNPEREGFADGAAASALFNAPAGIAVSDDGTIVYVADTGNHRIRKIQNGVVTTLAGTTTATDDDGSPLGGYADGEAAQAMFNLPMGIITTGNVLVVADSGNNAVRAVTAAGNVVTVAGNGIPGDLEGPATEAVFCAPSDVCYFGGSLYVADTLNNKIKVLPFNPDSLR